MRLSVATNFDPQLIEEIKNYPVVELFGKLREDAIGGGRAPYQLAPVDRNQLARHVHQGLRAGIQFNYLLNSSCLGNREITRRGQKDIEKLVDWICKIGVTSVTVASPFLLSLIKTRYPHLKVRISVFAGVDRVQKAKMWEELGADSIVLDSILVNREFKTLAQIRKSVKCDLELLANNNCLTGCALSPTHMNALSHAGQTWHENNGFFIDWCFLKCTEMKLRDPVNYIRSEWIRPEDLHIYEKLGFDLFKIAERDIPTAQIATRVKAYSERRYVGNLLDLIQPYAFKGVKKDDRYYKHDLRWFLRFFLRPGFVNPARMILLKRLAEERYMTRPMEGEEPVYIDNQYLDGFIEGFPGQGCREMDCEQCLWCHNFAEKAIRMDETSRARTLEAYDELFQAMHGGSMWRYLNGKMAAKISLKLKDYIRTPERKKHYNEVHFTEAAARYDFATRAMSLGRDGTWKKRLIKALPDLASPSCVDLACGTGDVTFLLAEKYPEGKIVGLDLTESMLEVARERNRYGHVSFTRQDMAMTDLPGESIDIVTGSYALRNAPDIHRSIGEIYRILKPGGVGAFLDFSKPTPPFFQIAQYWLLKFWCGFWGLALHRNPEIHGYIAASVRTFPDRSRLRNLLREAGFHLIGSQRFFMGITELIVIRKRQVPASRELTSNTRISPSDSLVSEELIQ